MAAVGDSFEKIGLHTNVCVALSAKGINGPRPQQAATLMHTTHDLCDVLATVMPHTGRHTLLISFASHCVLAANVPKFALVIASSPAAATKLSNVAKMLNIMGVTPFLVLDAADTSRTSGCVTPSLVITTLQVAQKWPKEEFLKCASMLVEDCAQCSPADLEAVMHTVSSASDPMNMFLLTTQSPSAVPVSIRYALHRRRRRFCSPNAAPPAFTFLLATDHDDRLNLLRKIVQIKSLRRMLVLTHSKEVKDLRMRLHQWGLSAFALGRNTVASEQSAVINEFITSSSAVLVASDAYAGLDLLDVDCVIQYYPPQKSMDEEEWADFIRCIRTTANPETSTRFITLLGTDDFTLGSYFMNRAECEPIILNVTPNHSRFADIVFNPVSVAHERVNQPLPASIDVPKTQTKAKNFSNNNNGGGGYYNGNNNNFKANEGGNQKKYNHNDDIKHKGDDFKRKEGEGNFTKRKEQGTTPTNQGASYPSNPQKEPKAKDVAPKSQPAAESATAASPSATEEAPTEQKSKRQERRDKYHAETKQQRAKK